MEIACKWLLLAYGSHSATHIQWLHFQVQKLRPREGLDLPKISIENSWQCHRPEIHLYQKLTRYVERKKKKKGNLCQNWNQGFPPQSLGERALKPRQWNWCLSSWVLIVRRSLPSPRERALHPPLPCTSRPSGWHRPGAQEGYGGLNRVIDPDLWNSWL